MSRLASTWCAGMPVWVCIERGKFSPGIVESVGRFKLTVVVLDGGDRLIHQVEPSFVAPRNPKRNGQDSPMLCGEKRGVA